MNISGLKKKKKEASRKLSKLKWDRSRNKDMMEDLQAKISRLNEKINSIKHERGKKKK